MVVASAAVSALGVARVALRVTVADSARMPKNSLRKETVTPPPIHQSSRLVVAVAAILSAIVVWGLPLLPACDHVKHAASSFVDCVSAPQGPIQTEIDKLWSQRKGGASWTDVGKTAEADAKGATFSGIAGCAFFTLEQEVLGTKDGVAAPPVTESNEMRIAGEKIRAAEGGPTYRTKFGDL